jgi:nitroreductase
VHDDNAPMIPLAFQRFDEATMRQRSAALLDHLATRRSVRAFSDEPVPLDVVERCILTAAQAPSGANKQPWTFVLVTDPDVRRQIRVAAEKEETAFYGGRAPQRWLDDLQPFGTDERKPFLERAPALIAIFAQQRGADGDKHYYVSESVGIAAGFLIAALHHAGLATLTHTPSPMRFLGEILGRPDSERAYLLLPVGYPAPRCEVPDIERKAAHEVLVRVPADRD